MLSTSIMEFEAYFSTRVPDLSRSDSSCKHLNYDRPESIRFSGSCMLPTNSQQVVPSKFYAIRHGIVPRCCTPCKCLFDTFLSIKEIARKPLTLFSQGLQCANSTWAIPM